MLYISLGKSYSIYTKDVQMTQMTKNKWKRAGIVVVTMAHTLGESIGTPRKQGATWQSQLPGFWL